MSKKKKKDDTPRARNEAWEIAFDMEDSVSAVRDLGEVLGIMAGGVGHDVANAIGRIGLELLEYAQQIEAERRRIAMQKP